MQLLSEPRDALHPHTPPDEPPGETTEEIEREVAADQLRLIYAKGGFVFPTSVLNGSLYALLSWNDTPHVAKLVWLAVIALVGAGRMLLRRAYYAARPTVNDTARWSRINIAGGFIYGAVWGSLALVAFPSDETGHLFLATVLVACTGVSSSLSASHMPSYFAFTLPATVPMAIRLFAQPTWFDRVLGLMLLVLVAQLTSLARGSGRASREAATLRHRLAALNRTLESRVAERTAELQSALAGRDEFIMVASHELQTPITSLHLAAQHLELIAGPPPAGEHAVVAGPPPAAEHAVVAGPPPVGEHAVVAGSQHAAEHAVVAGSQPAGTHAVPAGSPRAGEPDVLGRATATIVRQSRHLTRLIAQLLDVARIQAGAFSLAHDEAVDLGRAVRAAAARLRHEGENAGCELRVDAPDGLTGRFDGARVEEAVSNLIDNAIKFGAGRPIEVAASADATRARITVVDHGMGIADEVRPRIFNRFNRGASGIHYGGLGLGLYIARQIVEAHGGTISVASEPGSGARFTIDLPRLTQTNT